MASRNDRHSIMTSTRLAVLLLAVLPAQTVVADIVRGTMTGSDLPFGRLPARWDGIAAGQPFQYVFVFDSSTPDTDPSPIMGGYSGAILSGQVTIGGASAAISLGDITIENNAPGVWFDVYTTTVSLPGAVTLEPGLFDSSGTAFASDGLPAFVDLNSFPPGSARRFEIGTHNGTNVWIGQVQSLTYAIIPAPAAPAWLVAGLLASRGRRRQRSGRLW